MLIFLEQLLIGRALTLRYKMINKKPKVIFICTHNSARSQMAEGFLRTLYGDKYDVYSAGTKPTSINPYAIKVMSEIGIDISNQRSKSIDEFLDITFDFVITVCDHAKETCPFFPNGKNYIHKGFPDPSGFKGTDEEKLKIFRRVRDEIKKWIIDVFDVKDGERI